MPRMKQMWKSYKIKFNKHIPNYAKRKEKKQKLDRSKKQGSAKSLIIYFKIIKYIYII